MLVDGVTKLDKVKYGESAQAETVRKMIVAMSRDIRVLLIKLADRLHNARTWGFVPPEKAQKKATETLEIYAPLAHRLGIQTIKSELEDLSFAVLHPKLYAEIESLVKQRTPQREQYVHNVIEAVDARPARAAHPRSRDGPPEAAVLRVPEDGRARPRVRRHLRPHRHPHPGRQRARLLRRARRHPRAVDAAARPLQGLHRDAEVQPLPVAAHHGDRPGRAHRRDPDPHERDAPAGRVRRRGALEVQGAADRRQARRQVASTPTWRGSRTSRTGRPRRPIPASSSIRCGSRSAPRRSTSSRRRAA